MACASGTARPACAGLAAVALLALGLFGKAFCEVARTRDDRPGFRVRRAATLSGGKAGSDGMLGGGGAGAAAALRYGAAGLAALGAATAALAGNAGPQRHGRKRTGTEKTSLRYSTKKINPAFKWLKAGINGRDLLPLDVRTLLLGGCDICVGRTASGKLFALGDKAPPTGVSFSAGGEVQGEQLVEPQYGNTFNVSTGMPEGNWCPSPLILGPIIGAFMGGPQAVAVFQVREGWGGGEIEVNVDTNAKAAYEADYWKGLLDAQGKDDGSYY